MIMRVTQALGCQANFRWPLLLGPRKQKIKTKNKQKKRNKKKKKSKGRDKNVPEMSQRIFLHLLHVKYYHNGQNRRILMQITVTFKHLYFSTAIPIVNQAFLA